MAIESVSAAITAASGGELTTSDGLRMTVPPGALGADQQLTVDVVQQQVKGYDTLSLVYKFGPEGTTFTKPVSVTIPSTAGDGYVVFWSTADDPNVFEPVPTDTTMGGKIAFVRHFSSGFVGKDTSDACANVSCPAKASTCGSATTLTLTGAGVCVAGACVYPSETVECPSVAERGGKGCVNGACAVDCTNAQYNSYSLSDCDGSALTGCEAAKQIDPVNCGACGNHCAAGQTCVAGSCRTQGTPDGIVACAAPCADGYECVAGQCVKHLGPACTKATQATDCADLGAGAHCVEGHCEHPGPCTTATQATDCDGFPAGSICLDDHTCGIPYTGTACTAENVQTACSGFQNPSCDAGKCVGHGMSCQQPSDCNALAEELGYPMTCNEMHECDAVPTSNNCSAQNACQGGGQCHYASCMMDNECSGGTCEGEEAETPGHCSIDGNTCDSSTPCPNVKQTCTGTGGHCSVVTDNPCDVDDDCGNALLQSCDNTAGTYGTCTVGVCGAP